MTEALAINQDNDTAIDIRRDTYTRDQLDLIKRTYAIGSTDDEFSLFVGTAKRLGLNIFARQIYMLKIKGQMSIQVSIDGFRLVADRTGKYAPGRATEYTEKNGRLLSATAYVQKLIGDEWKEIGETAFFDEFNQDRGLWKTHPRVMIAKCAESRALRRAFPAELSGVYTDDELPPEDQQREAVEVIDAKFSEAAKAVDLVAQIESATTFSALEKLRPILAGMVPGSIDRDSASEAYSNKLDEFTVATVSAIGKTKTIDELNALSERLSKSIPEQSRVFTAAANAIADREVRFREEEAEIEAMGARDLDR